MQRQLLALATGWSLSADRNRNGTECRVKSKIRSDRSAMWRMGVPVATPVSIGDCLAAALAISRRGAHRPAFEGEVRRLLEATFVRGTNSGRAALFLTLQAMKQFSSRDEVVIPAFVCPSVGRAAVKAGLKPVLCDVGPTGSGLDLNSLERVISRRTLAVVTAHLFGYPCDIGPLLELSHSAGALVIEDAAQAFGAKFRGRYAGTMADAGIFSFGMSKVLWSIGGGLISTSRPELARYVGNLLSEFEEPGRLREAVGVCKFGVLSMLVRSHYLGPVATVWNGWMRGKHDCDDFVAAALPSSNAAVARALLPRLADITHLREWAASYYLASLSGLDGLTLPEVAPSAEPVFLRFPIIVKDVGLKKKLLDRLRAVGINVSEMYARSSYEALRQFTVRDAHCPHTDYLVERMLNLPTHPYVEERDLAAAVDAFGSVLGRRRAGAAVCTPVG